MLWGVLLSGVIGVVLRFIHITRSGLFFFDEGYYLNYNRMFVDLASAHPPQGFKAFLDVLYALLRVSLATGKALWFFVADARVLWGGAQWWFFPKIISALAGSLTLLLVYLFAKRFYGSKWVGGLSVVILAVLPSHVFYSRLSLQEALSTLFFILAFYFYFFPRKFGYRTFISSFLFACVFFTNYRLIIVPVLVASVEIFYWVALREGIQWRKFLWHTLIFFFFVFMVGNIDRAQNTIVTFSWMFHQAQLAQTNGPLQLWDFLSYPYYFFRLESFFFGLFFFANIWHLVRKEWLRAWPFLFVCLLMGLFSFAADQAARYLCVGLPFAAMAVASIIVFFFSQNSGKRIRVGIVALTVLLLGSLLLRSGIIAGSTSDYQSAVVFLNKIKRNVKFMSTQSYVQNLYARNRHHVAEAPHGFSGFLKLYSSGFDYLVVCPQAYISYTDSKIRFDPQLEGYLGFIVRQVKPVKVFPHFNEVMLERFVFEHNENFLNSLKFLRLKNRGQGTLRIYDVKECLQNIASRMGPVGDAQENNFSR